MSTRKKFCSVDTQIAPKPAYAESANILPGRELQDVLSLTMSVPELADTVPALESVITKPVHKLAKASLALESTKISNSSQLTSSLLWHSHLLSSLFLTRPSSCQICLPYLQVSDRCPSALASRHLPVRHLTLNPSFLFAIRASISEEFDLWFIYSPIPGPST